MTAKIRWQLFAMMALQFFIWGAWLPLIFGYLEHGLHFSPAQQSWILNAFPLAAIVGLFFSNQFADRRFAAQRFLACSHCVGGAAMLGLAFTHEFWPFLLLMAVHCLLYVPTISIANSIAFAHVKDAQREFGLVRMGGTIGWILAAWPFTFLFVDWDAVAASSPDGVVAWIGQALAHPLAGDALRDATRWTFVVAGAASLLLSLFSFTLPHTPPRPAQRPAWLEALTLLRHPYVLVLWLVAFADSFVHNCFFNWTGRFLGSSEVGIPSNWIMPVMSIGQVAEILTMFVLGATLRRLGWRRTMVVGVLGHAARFCVFAYLPQYPALVVAVNLLHGICYAFFFATVYIFVDDVFPKDVRASAQGLFNLLIVGVGMVLASYAFPLLKTTHTVDGVTDWRGVFLVPTGLAALGALLMVLFFRPPSARPAAAALAPGAH